MGLAFFAHPYFDDYDVANNATAMGPFASQWHWYQTWSGRIVTIFLDTMLNPLFWGKLGESGSHVLAGLRAILLLVMLAQIVALQQFFRVLLRLLTPVSGADRDRRQLEWLLALLLTALGLNAMPEPFSFLYWYSATFVYQLAWVFTLGFTTAALRASELPPGPQRRRWAGGPGSAWGWPLAAASPLCCCAR